MRDPLRVCQVVSSFRPKIGGVEKATETLVGALRHRGVEVSVITRRYPGLSAREVMDECTVHRAGIAGTGKVAAASFAVHSLWLLWARMGHAQVVHVQNVDTPLLVGILARRFLGKALVATIHGESKLERKQKSWSGRLRLALMRRHVDHFVALTEAMERALQAVGVEANRIRRISNPIDVGQFSPATHPERTRIRAQLGLEDAGRVCLFLGRLVPGKRVDLLISAWAETEVGSQREGTLLIVGDGPERSRLEKLSSAASSAPIRFEGSTPNVLQYLQAADVFVLASDAEGLPLALMEAMAVGLCAVVTDLPGYRHLVEDGVSGMVVPRGNREALRKKLDEAMRFDESRARLGEAARRRVVAIASVDAVTDEHLELYRTSITPEPSAQVGHRTSSSPRPREQPSRGFRTGEGDA